MLLPTRAILGGGRAVFLRVKSHCIHKWMDLQYSQFTVGLCSEQLYGHTKTFDLQSKTESYFHTDRMSEEEKGR